MGEGLKSSLKGCKGKKLSGILRPIVCHVIQLRAKRYRAIFSSPLSTPPPSWKRPIRSDGHQMGKIRERFSNRIYVAPVSSTK